MKPEEPSRQRRAREDADRTLAPWGYGHARYLAAGDGMLYMHIDCLRCGATVRVDNDLAVLHWRRHHPVRSRLLRLLERVTTREATVADRRDTEWLTFLLNRDRPAGAAKPVHSETTEPREDRP